MEENNDLKIELPKIENSEEQVENNNEVQTPVIEMPQMPEANQTIEEPIAPVETPVVETPVEPMQTPVVEMPAEPVQTPVVEAPVEPVHADGQKTVVPFSAIRHMMACENVVKLLLETAILSDQDATKLFVPAGQVRKALELFVPREVEARVKELTYESDT